METTMSNENIEAQAVVEAQAAGTRIFIRDALNRGEDISNIRLALGLQVATGGTLGTIVLITALVDEAKACQDAEVAYDMKE